KAGAAGVRAGGSSGGVEEGLYEVLFNYIHFHVLERLREFEKMKIVGGEFYEESNIVFGVNFRLSVSGEEMEVTLKYDREEFGEEQVKAISGYYERTLKAMARDGSQRYEQESVLSE